MWVTVGVLVIRERNSSTLSSTSIDIGPAHLLISAYSIALHTQRSLVNSLSQGPCTIFTANSLHIAKENIPNDCVVPLAILPFPYFLILASQQSCYLIFSTCTSFGPKSLHHRPPLHSHLRKVRRLHHRYLRTRNAVGCMLSYQGGIFIVVGWRMNFNCLVMREEGLLVVLDAGGGKRGGGCNVLFSEWGLVVGGRGREGVGICRCLGGEVRLDGLELWRALWA